MISVSSNDTFNEICLEILCCPPKMPRQAITISQKASLRAYHASNPSLDQKALRLWFHQQHSRNISQSSVSEVLSARYQNLDHLMHKQRLRGAKRRRAERWPLLEAALLEWLIGINDQSLITTALLREKAQWLFPRIPEYRGMSLPKFSDSWIEGFRARHQTAPSHIPEGNACVASHAPGDQYMREIRHVLSAYQPQDQYFCAETSLYWKMLPESALVRVPICRLEEKRTRLSALLCTNMDGSHRLPPWYIGRNPNPRAFHSAGGHIVALGMIWRHNSSARMTRTAFREFLHWFDTRLQGRKVVLLLDALSAQRVLVSNSQSFSQDSRNLGFKNMIIIRLPTSCTDVYHHLKLEITGIWKTYYRRHWMQHVYNQFSAHRDPLTTVNVMKAIKWACCAWHDDVNPQNIRNCFERSGCLGIGIATGSQVGEEEEVELKEAKQQLQGAIEQLEQMSFLYEAMEIDIFINPPFESSERAWIEEEQATTLPSSVEVPEGDSDEEIE